MLAARFCFGSWCYGTCLLTWVRWRDYIRVLICFPSFLVLPMVTLVTSEHSVVVVVLTVRWKMVSITHQISFILGFI